VVEETNLRVKKKGNLNDKTLQNILWVIDEI
jgi:hypothetical protein